MLLLIGFSSIQKQSFEKPPIKDKIFSNFCPLCGSGLKKGEKVKSATYPVKPGSDGRYSGGIEKMMEVYGCPNCTPPDGKEKRICPVCKKEVPENGYVVGRYFIVNDTDNYPSGIHRAGNVEGTGKQSSGGIPETSSIKYQKKNHLHVLGCTRCRRV